MTYQARLPKDLPPFGPELELLLLCARINLNSSQKNRVQQIVTGQLDWSLLLRMATLHRLSLLLFRNLQLVVCNDIPEHVLEDLHQAAITASANNLLFTANLHKIIALFNSNTIQAIPFKGPALSQAAYANINLRWFGDLDILVEEKDAIKARNLLIANGYSCRTQITGSTEAAFITKENCFAMVNTSNNIYIDLHWEMTGRYSLVPLYLEDIIERATTIKLAVWQFPTLSVEDNIVFLCIHSSKHCWQPLEGINCISELIRNTEKINWLKVFEQSRHLRAHRIVLLGLLLCHLLFDLELPPLVMAELDDNKNLLTFGKKILHRLTLDPVMQEQDNYSCQFSTLHTCIRDSFPDRIKHLCRFLCRIFFRPTSKDRQAWPLPSSLTFLYYFYRPLRLIWEWGRKKGGKE
ncbi:MAG: nucleotidyltransferase family protein [Proteobacteria bacterium]|nr:nucleotidyltransferase family protein [Pseudomonadota bacterium]MBU1139781.1 nucleotidyltransferase family protein [Pseudomonadota bacterium]